MCSYCCDQHRSAWHASVCADALVRAGKPCRVLALINDSVGVLTASCYFDQATEMGVILGTGTNACIVDKVCTNAAVGAGSGQAAVVYFGHLARTRQACSNLLAGSTQTRAGLSSGRMALLRNLAHQSTFVCWYSLFSVVSWVVQLHAPYPSGAGGSPCEARYNGWSAHTCGTDRETQV